MREYPIKRTVLKSTRDNLEEIIKEHFGNAELRDGWYISSYGAFKAIKVRLDGNRLLVETESSPDVDDRTAMDSIKVYNRFLEKATGYTAKERKKMLSK